GSTTLMWAAYNEEGDTPIIDELLRLGVDVNAKNSNGETALVWASRRGPTRAVEALKKAGARQDEWIEASIQNALKLLDKSGQQFVRVSGCESCHHQSLPQMAAGMARSHGVMVNEDAARAQNEAVIAMFHSYEAEMSKGTDRIPDPPITVSYALHG